MNSLIRQVLGEARESETRTYRVTAHPKHLDQIEELFWWMNSTRSGHSGSAKIYIDGDGAARVEIKKTDGELKKPDQEPESKCNGKPEFEVGLE